MSKERGICLQLGYRLLAYSRGGPEQRTKPCSIAACTAVVYDQPECWE